MKVKHHGPNGDIGPADRNDDDDIRVHKKALLKLDLILLSTVTVIYFLNFLDRYVDLYSRVCLANRQDK